MGEGWEGGFEGVEGVGVVGCGVREYLKERGMGYGVGWGEWWGVK